MRKRDICIICGSKATCFMYHDGGYLSYCIDHYKQTGEHNKQNEFGDKKNE